MTPLPQPLSTLDDLRVFVHEVLCEKENLLPEQSRLQELPLVRGGTVCGLQFFVNGPRLVRLGAIWAADRNVLYLYDARGERYSKIPLEERIPFSITPESLAS